MVEDLKKAYFERDLSDWEEDRLAVEIAGSGEAALVFAGYAEEAYKVTGLPEPKY